MTTVMQKVETVAWAAMRIVSGLALSMHGMQKILGVLADHPAPAMFTQMWLGGVIELVCGLLLAIGLLVRPAAFLASGTMAVAYLQFHWKFRFDENLFPVKNGGELALIYCFLFFAFFAFGAGSVSLDALIKARASRRAPAAVSI